MAAKDERETGTVIDKISITLSTLAQSAILTSAGPAVTRGGKIISSTFLGGINTFTSGNGPLIWGIFDSTMTSAQVEAYLENEGPLAPTDTAKAEIATRGKNLRILGVLTPSLNIASLVNRKMSGLRFAEVDESASGWTTFIYNLGPALDTGAEFDLLAVHFVQWNPSG